MYHKAHSLTVWALYHFYCHSLLPYTIWHLSNGGFILTTVESCIRRKTISQQFPYWSMYENDLKIKVRTTNIYVCFLISRVDVHMKEEFFLIEISFPIYSSSRHWISACFFINLDRPMGRLMGRGALESSERVTYNHVGYF